MTDNVQLGLSSGPVGRTIRLLLGIFLVYFVSTDLISTEHAHSLASYALVVISFIALAAVCITMYFLLNRSRFANNALVMTLLFVVPTLYLIIAPEIDSSQQIGHWLNYPDLNHPFRIALLLYLGVSFLLQWHDKYGGCEMVAIPNYLFKRTSASYCIPLLPVDIIEKAIRKSRNSKGEE